MAMMQSRRRFVVSTSAAGATLLAGGAPLLADEGPPETTTLRLPASPNICTAPQLVAEELLRGEGFTDIRYVPTSGGLTEPQMAERGEIDIALSAVPALPFTMDAGTPIMVLAGVHAGCFELFAHEPVRVISDLKGKRVGIRRLTTAGHLYLVIMAASVGLDPHKDIEWITSSTGNPMELFAERKVDAFLAFPPEPQELRARKVGRVILNLGTDKPWSQYFCCMLYGSRSFVRDHPVATKRAIRAILKAADLCAADPKRAARRLVEGGFTQRYDYALQTLTEIPYTRWRDYDAEDTMRFFALRLHEVGMIRSSPNKLIAEGTDWRFLNEIKRELKA